MSDTDEAYLIASVVAELKEKAITEAFNNYFSSKEWTDDDLAALSLESVVDLTNGGIETMSINGQPVLEFGLMKCRVDISVGHVQCFYSQTIKPLYGCGTG